MDKKIKFTPEQLTELQTFFQQNDFTANMTLDREYDFSAERSEIFVRAKKDFRELLAREFAFARCKPEDEKLFKGLSGKLFGECRCGLFFRRDFKNLCKPRNAEQVHRQIF